MPEQKDDMAAAVLKLQEKLERKKQRKIEKKLAKQEKVQSEVDKAPAAVEPVKAEKKVKV